MTAELVIAPLDPAHGEGLLDALDTLLRDAVESGASVGFLPPLAPEESRAFWQETLDEVAARTRLALGAWQDERLVGTVHLALATKPNARHRGEVQKLLVHTTARRQGTAQTLLDAIERAALASSDHMKQATADLAEVIETAGSNISYHLKGTTSDVTRFRGIVAASGAGMLLATLASNPPLGCAHLPGAVSGAIVSPTLRPVLATAPTDDGRTQYVRLSSW
jgi:GNAT superfamily N-acetyltransferase